MLIYADSSHSKHYERKALNIQQTNRTNQETRRNHQTTITNNPSTKHTYGRSKYTNKQPYENR